MKEIFKDIPNYEGYYQASNLGNIKSLARYVKHPRTKEVLVRERILKQGIDSRGYHCVVLFKKGKGKTKNVHKLVAECFLNHKPCGYKFVVNHINFNKLDNNVDNLEIVSQRTNANRKHLSSSSKYVGVGFCKNRNKWRSRIVINGKDTHLGYFLKELDAHNAYQNKLKEI